MTRPTLFPGRLGLAEARIPHADRHGLLWLARGRLYVEDGTLRFLASGSDTIEPGNYAIPYQSISMILLGPGTSVTHDVLRLLARHGTLLAAVGEGGVKFYTAPPIGQGRSDIARAHARLWADEEARLEIARKMYALRFRDKIPSRDIATLRGIEGARLKVTYQLLAKKYGVEWKGRKYDRQNPLAADPPNQAINHAATVVESAAEVAVAAVGALPPLGFIHEDSSNAFTLDIADLWRDEVTLPLAFATVAQSRTGQHVPLEREVRYQASIWFRRTKLIASMIDRIKELLVADDCGGNSKRI
ncbi:MAG: type I-E CRISPR-associated endonuclease Cas1e [Chloroflexota bacterium]